MNPRSLRLAASLLLLAILAAPALAADASSLAGKRPNVVVILVDDMGFSDVGCYGSEIQTPNIDALAAGGIRFTQFYNTGRCCPTRASLMTGLHPHQVGIGHMTETAEGPLGFEGPYQGHLNDRCTTLAQVLGSAGYHTLMTGKWHLGYHDRGNWPLQRGFDRYFGCIDGAVNYFKPGGKQTITLGNDHFETSDDFYATDAFTDRACDFISEATEADDRPFFLYLAYNAPHWPLNAKAADFEKYRGKYTGGWEPLMKARLAKQKELGLFPADIEPAPAVGPKWESLSEKQRDDSDAIMAAFAGCLDSVDQNIGKLVAHLREIGELEDTVILFLSDNGACQESSMLGKGSEEMVRNPPLETTDGVRLGMAWANACNTPFRLYKHYVHEGGACTPLIVSWPAMIREDQAGRFERNHAYLPDVMATLVELCSASYPSGLPRCEGKSMLPLFAGEDRPIHTDPIFWEHEGNAAVRDGQWKLVREYEKPWELYDLSVDRTEMHDLAAEEPARRDRMIALWTGFADRVGVAYPQRFNMYEYIQARKKKQQE